MDNCVTLNIACVSLPYSTSIHSLGLKASAAKSAQAFTASTPSEIGLSSLRSSSTADPSLILRNVEDYLHHKTCFKPKDTREKTSGRDCCINIFHRLWMNSGKKRIQTLSLCSSLCFPSIQSNSSSPKHGASFLQHLASKVDTHLQ